MPNRFQRYLYFLRRRLNIRVFGVPQNVYINGFDHVCIGSNVYLGPGVCITTANHDIRDPGKASPPEPISIGDHSWIGANAVILPGVILGSHTVVGAGAIVTKSFPEGHVVIAGNPARKIKDIDIGDTPE